MYKLLYPLKDSTIYEKYPERNAGIDQILEITKFAQGEAVDDVVCQYASWGTTYNSRIVMSFDLTDIEAKIASSEITGSVKYYLTMKSSESHSLPLQYTLYAYPITETWKNGNGNFNDSPQITSGVSWKYRSSLNNGDSWSADSGSQLWTSATGGGTWNSSYECSQSFNYESPDLRMDITTIVDAWLNGDVDNNGLIIKHSDANELSSEIFGSIKYFGRESHTIYLPTLQVLWTDTTYSGSFNSTTPIDEQYVLYIKNLKDVYREGERVKLRIGARDTFPARTYVTSSQSVPDRLIPSSSMYSIVDYVTGIEIVPFDSTGTLINTDDNGHYIVLDSNNFLPDRYYKILFKIVNDGMEEIYDNDFNFRIRK